MPGLTQTAHPATHPAKMTHPERPNTCTAGTSARLGGPETHSTRETHFQCCLRQFCHRGLIRPSPGPAGNKAEYQRESAWGIWEEYYSERSAAETIAGVCQAVAPGIEVGFAATLDHADLVLTYLDGFGTFVRDQVRSFRYGQID